MAVALPTLQWVGVGWKIVEKGGQSGNKENATRGVTQKECGGGERVSGGVGSLGE
jgi:hypothetical protein